MTKQYTNIEYSDSFRGIGYNKENCEFIGITSYKKEVWRSLFPHIVNLDNQLIYAAIHEKYRDKRDHGRYIRNWLMSCEQKICEKIAVIKKAGRSIQRFSKNRNWPGKDNGNKSKLKNLIRLNHLTERPLWKL